MGKCVSCGAGLTENSKFCSLCGHPTSAEETATRTVATSRTISSSSRGSSDGQFLPGATVGGRYRIIALLGRGGMGEVYRADDLTLGQQVALKFLPAVVANNPNAVDRFRNEVRIARRVSHPNVCRVYDLGEIDGHLFLSMEYVDGEDLGSLLRRIGRLPADKALEIARKLCAGLAAAHEKGVLHRDLKPANVMLDGRGQVLLTDFGLAGLADQIEGAEVRNGTPAYMAPEQLSGKEVTVKSDLYSLGLVIYEILTGKRPFDSLDRRESTPTNPSTLVKDLDPRVERAVMRCLEADPEKRPASALAVAAALPGGDPLAEALAAGDTPSPEMVAAAGEGTALAPRIAIGLFAAIVAGLIVQAILSQRLSALERMHLEYSPEVLKQKARDIIQRLGYTERPADDVYSFGWDSGMVSYAESQEHPQWDTILKSRPTMLGFYYRQSNYPLTAGEFHDDNLTPGIVTQGETYADPAPIMSGMIGVTLDAQGRLISFRAIPPQFEESAGRSQPFDWKPLFEAAQLDPATLQPAEPQWTFLGTSDQRAAWTGKWPGTGWPLRVEAAAFQGKPVAFSLLGPWSAPGRMPPRDPPLRGHLKTVMLAGVVVVLLAIGPWLAWRNWKAGRSDRRGAFRLAHFIFWVQMLLWLLRGHLNANLGTFGNFMVAIFTAVGWAAAMWTLYVALEPYARKYWPQALIAWAGVLSGRFRDPIVGRDVLFGLALGIVWTILDRITDFVAQARGITPNYGDTAYLAGTRSTLGACVAQIPASIEVALVFFLIFFVLRTMLRNQWLAAVVFALLWTTINQFSARPAGAIIQGLGDLAIFSIAAFVIMRFGLLALIVGLAMIDLLSGLQIPSNPSLWYFADTLGVVLAMFAMAIWAFRTSMGGKRLLNLDQFG
ncbi:MAG TPA: serine/threonine-protein kinase [Bryobacteraceae bacterium]|nr:serine/threonine-protein kinase [Bryobacteraceae bacterium]